MAIQTEIHPPATGDPLHMPPLYFERTTLEEQTRHREKLARLAGGRELLIDPVVGTDGGWHVEIVTMDWDEPGLLDRIFEAVLKCIHVPGGIAFKHIRIFTGASGQVVNILELQDKRGDPISQENCELVLELLRQIAPGERAVLETIMNLTFSTLIPQLTEFPSLDNGRSDTYTYLELGGPRLSNRFTSMLLHFLARSEFRVNVQVAEFVDGEKSRYSLWVVDKHGHKLRDSHFNRIGMVRALEAMNQMILEFNLHYIRTEWQRRIERNNFTIYQSRPDPGDFLADLETIRQLAKLMGFPERLSALVEHGLIDSKGFYFLKKFEAFCQEHREQFRALRGKSPDADDVVLCRDYIEQRRRSLRILEPLFHALFELNPIRPHLSDVHRAHALCRPISNEGFALDPDHRLYLTGSIWIEEPETAFVPFTLMARTGCILRTDTHDAVEAALEGWTPQFIAEHRSELGRTFRNILDEGLKQGNVAIVLRNLRQVGLLQRYLPGFDYITGLIHVIADHAYTVDEHSIRVAEALSGMMLLNQVFPEPGASRMRKDYENIESAIGLANYARKYAAEERMLRQVPQLSNHTAIAPFFQLMEEVRSNTLEYLVEVNLLDHAYSTCMNALHQIEVIRKQLEPLIRQYVSLPFSEWRVLMLSALLHDMKKPDQDHGRLFAPEIPATLAATGMELDPEDVQRIGWVVHHHLEISPLLKQMGAEGEEALPEYVIREGNPSLMRSLILFTYADRVAVQQDPNKATHDAMTLSSLLESLARWETGNG